MAPARRHLAGLGAALLLAACGGGTPEVENVLLVTLDTTRADHLGCYGNAGAATPVLDGLARRGVVFDACIAVAPLTLPAHASILTGRYPFTHGARNNATHHLPAGAETLAERLSAAGFATGAVVSSIVLDSRYGLDQGFASYDDDLAEGRRATDFMFRETPAEDGVRRALTWLEGLGDERWFLWLHLFDPHAGYEPPEPFATRFAQAPYDGEIAYADTQLGRLLEALEQGGELARTLVVVIGDHGEALGEHGERTHGVFVYDATTRVPFIVAHPGLAGGGRRVVEVVSQVDVAPTVLELAGLEPPTASDGISLAGVLRGGPAPPERPAYSESMLPRYNHGWADLRSLRGRGWRYVRAPRPELYDLQRDPGEIHDLAATDPEGVARRERALAALLPAREADVRDRDPEDLDPALRAELAALGYVWSAGAEDGAGELADPKDRIATFERVVAAKSAAAHGAFEQSEALLREVLEQEPGSPDAREALVYVLQETGRTAEALEELRRVAALEGERFRNFVQMAVLERELGASDGRALLERAKELDPRDPEPWCEEGNWAHEDGDVAAARSAYARALELDEHYAPAWLGLGHLEHAAGRGAQAAQALERATECDPTLGEAWYDLGLVAAAAGDPERARDAFEHARARTPDDPAVLAGLGEAQAKLGQAEEARATLERAVELDPGQLAAVHNLAVLLQQAGATARAGEVLAQACAADTVGRTEAWRRMLPLARACGDARAALCIAERVLAERPDSVQALTAAGLAEGTLGREDAALAHLARALELEGERLEARARKDPELARWLARIRERAR